jgi:DeoR/GlpR family transcriptional regulator of sugar metabolism
VVVDGQTIALNSGTTNVEVAKYLVENYYRLTIITNNLRIIDILKHGKDFTIIVPGGMFDPDEYAIFGKTCEDDILSYNIDTALIAVNGISCEKGITDFRMKEVGIIRALLTASKYKVVVADFSKFDRVAYLNVCDLSEIDCILTNSGISDAIAAKYEKLNVKVISPKAGM